MFEKILENIADGILILNKQSIIIWCNTAALQMLEEPREQVIGRKANKYFPDSPFQVSNHYDWTGKQAKEILLTDLVHIDNETTAIFFREVSFLPKEKGSTLMNKSSSEFSTTSVPKSCINFESIVGQNKKFLETLAMAKRAALTISPVLIYGETGTGKELFAQSIHYASERADKSFIAVNCAAIPETLLEGILFGTVQGAFTEAINRPGLFEQASQGTIFLDEINSMPLSLQAKLLRVIQEKTVRRVGGVTDILVNPKIISSLNVEPFEAVAKRMIRSDLFYRLGVVCLEIPPLRERKDDLPILTNFFVKNICLKLNKPLKSISPEVLEIFNQNDWPGNIRQLEHAIECAVNYVDNDQQITLSHFPHYLRFISIDLQEPESLDNNDLPLKTEMKHTERDKIITVLEQAKGSISQAARILGLSRQSLYYRLKKHSISIYQKDT